MSWRFSITSFSPWEIVNCDIAYTSELISIFRYPVAVVISDCLSKLLPSPFRQVDDAGMVEWWHWSWTVHRLWILPVSDAMRAELESKWMKLVWKCIFSLFALLIPSPTFRFPLPQIKHSSYTAHNGCLQFALMKLWSHSGWCTSTMLLEIYVYRICKS